MEGNLGSCCIGIHTLIDEPYLLDISQSNMLWIAGLNSGLTNEALSKSMVVTDKIEKNIAIPVSICNGFSTGKQFEWDTRLLSENDKPDSFTDEDWITHAGGWLSGLSRLTNMI
ncbi:MAG: hypothetical protein PF518_02560 [Spirochaetaceae bacterium]|nr:hypothetical protein [Spirochaetaceae bacterium]